MNFLHLCYIENLIFMALIKSISGIRGTIGGRPGESLSPVDIVKFAAAFGTWLHRRHNKTGLKYLGKTVRLYPSSNPKKKYEICDPVHRRWVHFGQVGYEDFTRLRIYLNLLQ